MISRSPSQVPDSLFRDKAVGCQPVFEICAVTRRAGAVQETDEVLKEGIGAALGHEHQAVVLRGEWVRVLEVLPKIQHGPPAFFVCRTDGEAAFDLTDELPIGRSRAFTDNQKVVRVPAEMLCLETDLRHGCLGQDRRNTAHE